VLQNHLGDQNLALSYCWRIASLVSLVHLRLPPREASSLGRSPCKISTRPRYEVIKATNDQINQGKKNINGAGSGARQDLYWTGPLLLCYIQACHPRLFGRYFKAQLIVFGAYMFLYLSLWSCQTEHFF
jgi:hypothetical protein